jgi:hypothetical protein
MIARRFTSSNGIIIPNRRWVVLMKVVLEFVTD